VYRPGSEQNTYTNIVVAAAVVVVVVVNVSEESLEGP
jgi:hypothetical protein